MEKEAFMEKLAFHISHPVPHCYSYFSMFID